MTFNFFDEQQKQAETTQIFGKQKQNSSLSKGSTIICINYHISTV